MILDVIFFTVAVIVLARSLTGLNDLAQASLAKRQSSPKLTSALTVADGLYAAKRYHSAEKAYLAVLKIDHKNISAYNHLGIIYSHLKNYPDAIECFQIATQLVPSATTYHNLGLVFYENRNYIKAIAAYEKSIMFEASAMRYMALGKAYQKVSDEPKTIAALEKAASLEPENLRILRALLEVYSAGRNPSKVREIANVIIGLDPKDAKAHQMLARITAKKATTVSAK